MVIFLCVCRAPGPFLAGEVADSFNQIVIVAAENCRRSWNGSDRWLAKKGKPESERSSMNPEAPGERWKYP